jgi:hypothetical protein
MLDELCSCSGCHVEVVAWIDGGAWCGAHALEVLSGASRRRDGDEVSAVRARRRAERAQKRRAATALK